MWAPKEFNLTVILQEIQFARQSLSHAHSLQNAGVLRNRRQSEMVKHNFCGRHWNDIRKKRLPPGSSHRIKGGRPSHLLPPISRSEFSQKLDLIRPLSSCWRAIRTWLYEDPTRIWVIVLFLLVEEHLDVSCAFSSIHLRLYTSRNLILSNYCIR